MAAQTRLPLPVLPQLLAAIAGDTFARIRRCLSRTHAVDAVHTCMVQLAATGTSTACRCWAAAGGVHCRLQKQQGMWCCQLLSVDGCIASLLIALLLQGG